MGRVPLIALIFVCFALLSGPAAAQDKKHDWRSRSARGQLVNTADYRGKVVVVVINHPSLAEATLAITRELALKLGHNPEVSVLRVVDLGDLELYKRPFATKKLALDQKREVKRIQQILKEHNKAPIQRLHRKLHMFADFEGGIIGLYDIWSTKEEVTLVVVNKQGDVMGSFKGSRSEEALEAVEASLAE